MTLVLVSFGVSPKRLNEDYDMAVTADKPAPYAPPSAIIQIIERYRDRGLPSPVNAEVLARSGISESLIPRTIQALMTFDLIGDDGKPTDTFESIRKAPNQGYQQSLEDWLTHTYADIFAFTNASTDDEDAIRDAFRNYRPFGQQSRMVTLFTGLCVAAGMRDEGQPKASKRPRKVSPRLGKRKPVEKPRMNPAGGGPDVPAALSGLLASMPNEGQGWTQEDRDKFVNTFKAVLDFCFPIIEKTASGQEEDEQEEAGS